MDLTKTKAMLCVGCSALKQLSIKYFTKENVLAEGGGLLHSDLVSCFSNVVSGGRGA